MLGFGHQTFFNLCLALFTLAAVSVVCLGLLLVERQNYDLLQQNVSTLRAENNRLKSELDRFRNSTDKQHIPTSRSYE
jgi:hypothetical protein